MDATSSSANLVAQPVTDRTIVYGVSDAGVTKAIPLWGLDTAWVSETNIRRGVAFMGAEQVDIVRVSFTPTAALVDGDLQTEQADLLTQRLDYVDLVGPHAAVVLNADPPTIDPWFTDANGAVVPALWADLIDVTARRCEERGRTVLAAQRISQKFPSVKKMRDSVTASRLKRLERHLAATKESNHETPHPA